MAGGTFTISNGGVFGSLMGTPIINPPQSAILGMHATKMRAVVGPDVRVPEWVGFARKMTSRRVVIHCLGVATVAAAAAAFASKCCCCCLSPPPP